MILDAFATAIMQRLGRGVASPPTGDEARDTLIINDALRTGKRLQRGVYKHDGRGIDVGNFALVGEGNMHTTITLPAGGYIVDADRAWNSLLVQGVRVEGGAGVIRNRSLNVAVLDRLVVTDCVFVGFTGAAISHNHSDNPYWDIRRCTFDAGNVTTSIGIALRGLSDKSVIAANNFVRYKIGIKLGASHANTTIADNDFIQFQAGSERAAVWLVPKATNVDAGVGTVVEKNKFGNENIGPDDYGILIADEGPGTWFGDRLPSAAPSVGYETGLRVRDNLFNGGDYARALVATRTPHVSGAIIDGNHIAGTLPAHVLHYLNELPTKPTGTVLGVQTLAYPEYTVSATNADPAHFAVVDPLRSYSDAAAVSPAQQRAAVLCAPPLNNNATPEGGLIAGTSVGEYVMPIAWKPATSDPLGFQSADGKAFTVPEGMGGVYHIEASLRWGPGPAGARSLIIECDGLPIVDQDHLCLDGQPTPGRASIVVDLPVGAHIKVGIYQGSGQTLPLDRGSFTMVRVSA